MELGLRRGAAYRSLISACDDDLAEGAPGHALTVMLPPLLAGEGVRLFDFLPPNDPSKLAFATGATAMGAFYRPFNARGAALAVFALSRVRPLAKDAIYALTDRGFPLDAILRQFDRARETRSPSGGDSPVRGQNRFTSRAPKAI